MLSRFWGSIFLSRCWWLCLLPFTGLRLASLVGTLRWARFLRDEKSGKESLRAFPPKDPPWGTGLVVRQVYGRPWFRTNPGKQLLLARCTARQVVDTSPPGPDPGGLQPFPAAGSLTIGGWQQPQHQKKARTWKLPSP